MEPAKNLNQPENDNSDSYDRPKAIPLPPPTNHGEKEGQNAEPVPHQAALINRERKNDRVYVGLFAPSPTMLWDDKELPNVPLSQLNAVDGRPAPGSVQVLRESLASEGSVGMSGPVTGIISLNLPVR